MPARLAFDVYCYRLRKYIGAYYAALGRPDAIVFTAGVGENAPAVRAEACIGLEALGIHLNADRNTAAGGEVSVIHAGESDVKLLVVRTNEEREIAEQTRAVLAAGR